MVHHALRSEIQFVDRDMQRKQAAPQGGGQSPHLVVAPRPRLTKIVPSVTEGIKGGADERRGGSKTAQAFNEETQQTAFTFSLHTADASGPTVGKNAGNPLFNLRRQESDFVRNGGGGGGGVRGWGNRIAFNVGGRSTVHDLNQGVASREVSEKGVAPAAPF